MHGKCAFVEKKLRGRITPPSSRQHGVGQCLWPDHQVTLELRGRTAYAQYTRLNVGVVRTIRGSSTCSPVSKAQLAEMNPEFVLLRYVDRKRASSSS